MKSKRHKTNARFSAEALIAQLKHPMGIILVCRIDDDNNKKLDLNLLLLP